MQQQLKNIIFLLIFTCLFTLKAQQMNGTFGSNHFGLNNLELNPSSMANSSYWMNIRVFGAHAFFSNNFLYTPGAVSLFQFIPNADGDSQALSDFKNLLKTLKQGEIVDGDEVDGLRLNINSINLRLQATIHGPGLSLTQGRNTFGFAINYKVIVDGRYVDYVLMNLLLDQNNLQYIAAINNYAQIQALDPEYQKLLNGKKNGFQLGRLQYAEIPMTYARAFTYGDNFFSFGGTLKIIIPYQYEEYFVDDKPPLDPNNVGVTALGLLPGISYFKADRLGALFGNSGLGLGLDLGFTWYKMDDQATHYNPHFKKDRLTDGLRYRGTTMGYQYKFGVAFTDIGFANISGEEAVIFPDLFAFEIRRDPRNALKILKDFMDPSERIVLLPTAVNFSFDYRLKKTWYLNATYIQHLHRYSGIGAPDLLSVAVRHETHKLEYAFPVSLLDWKTLQIGWMVRYYWVTFGMDDILSVFNPFGVRNVDFYLQLSVPIVTHPAMKEYNDKKSWRDTHDYRNPLR